MEKEKIAGLEYLFNCYSLRIALHKDKKEENLASMVALEMAVNLFGYKFEFKGMAKSNGTVYREYELVEINE